MEALKHNAKTIWYSQKLSQKLKLSGVSVEHPKFSLPPQIMQSIEEEYQFLNRKLNRS
jgi:hypothetical protein